APPPTWGYCESQCTGLDELTCIDTAGCRAIYVAGAFGDCWSTDQNGPIQGGGCAGLDAYECSRHDDCSAVHGVLEAFGEPEEDAPEFAIGIGAFESCIPEKGSCDADPESCEPIPGSCEGEAICPMAPPDCPSGTTPGIAGGCYTGYCIPLADCGDGDPDPGLCYAPVDDGQAPPACPEGTTPGIAGGYYTGYCIPLALCEAAPACADIPAEATCIAREDCTPLYEGVDCVCEGDACTCADWVYTTCS
ncbi:MAG TPA: hypothetical protein VKZ63_18810, partial [Kofleriaceae bacterium]|nr:hypothetical protein [Kofleriaceae bacterium]